MDGSELVGRYEPLVVDEEEALLKKEDPFVSYEEELVAEIPEAEKEKMSTVKAYLTFLKCSWGIGFLGTPYGISQGGWLAGLLGIIFLTVFISYTTKLLIRAKLELKKNGVIVLTLADMTKAVFGPGAMGFAVFLLAFTQLSCCVLYCIFISRSFAAIITPHDSAGFWYGVIVICTLPFFTAVSMVRKMAILAPIAMLANVFMITIALIIIVYGATHGKICTNPLTGVIEECVIYAARFSTFPIFVGVVTYAMEGINAVLPIHEAMEEPAQFNFVIDGGMWTMCALYSVFGIVCYHMFQNTTQSVISLNVEGSTGVALKIIVSLTLFASYPLQMFPVTRVIDDVFGWDKDTSESKFKSALSRFGLVFSTILVAVAVPHFGNLLSLSGSVCFTLLGFVYPAGIFLKIMGDEASRFDKVACYVTFILSACIFSSGLIVNIQDLSSHPSS